MMIENIRLYIDVLDMDKLYSLCVSQPDRFFTYVSPRYIGKKRMDKLTVFLCAQRDNIPDKHFLKILLARCEGFSSDILFY